MARMSWLKFLRRREWHYERAREIDSYLDIETADCWPNPPRTVLIVTLKGCFGTKAYAAEDLIAERGAPFLYSDLGLTNDRAPITPPIFKTG